jgi:hypothetical protein
LAAFYQCVKFINSYPCGGQGPALCPIGPGFDGRNGSVADGAYFILRNGVSIGLPSI